MKNIRLAPITAAFAIAALFSSCKKDDAVAANVNASSTLDAGKSGIMFNTNTTFVTNNSFSVRNTTATNAFTSTNAGTRSILLSAVEVNGTTEVREASISISLPSTSGTAQGNIVANLATASTVIASVNLISDSGPTAGTSYDSESGTLTITKLTAAEIEGTFSGTVSNGTSSYVITNGSFAGKFY